MAEGRAARWLAPCFAPRRPAVLAPGSPTAASGKKQAAKSKEELAQEKKKELERRLQDVSGQLSGSKKPAKKGSRRQAPPLRGAGSPAAALLLGRRWEGPGGRWVADPALSLWLHCVTSHVSVHEALPPGAPFPCLYLGIEPRPCSEACLKVPFPEPLERALLEGSSCSVWGQDRVAWGTPG